MADPDDDARISAGYRALGAEQPPPSLDAAILAAARRQRSRWRVPVSIAAVLVLAVGVTLRVQLEQPDVAEPLVLEPEVMRAPAPATAPGPAAARADKSALAAKREAAAPATRDELRERRAAEAPASQVAGAAAPVPAPAPANIALGKISAAPEAPEQWLERIAKLRAAGKVREADQSLAEFKRRYPDYRMSEAMRARVAPR
jgi:hypothetical protein